VDGHSSYKYKIGTDKYMCTDIKYKKKETNISSPTPEHHAVKAYVQRGSKGPQTRFKVRPFTPLPFRKLLIRYEAQGVTIENITHQILIYSDNIKLSAKM
jgi:hypothetical protein